ncbi:hypothetical protein [Dactylosporangium sp. CA-092794]|uniref:acyl-CoA-like ligand-binding transcription factor n=1 Tax=Dactylosporangium sp. CA-092794 TaxID=3239929 RepID=UPI003D8BCF92
MAEDIVETAFEPLTQHVDSQQDPASVRALHQAIFSTPALLGRYLQQLHAAQQEAAELLRARPHGARLLDGTVDDGLIPLATVGAAFAYFVAAQETWSRRDATLSLSALLDRAMSGASPITQLH